MKYVAVLALLLILIRIDFILETYEKLVGKISEPSIEISEGDIKSNRETLPLSKDKNFNQTPRIIFLALLENFKSSPTQEVREQAMALLKKEPKLLNIQGDREFESAIYAWRDLLKTNEPEVISFLVDLMSVLKDENLEVIKRFFSVWMDINMEHFIVAYSKTKDSACSIATTFGDPIPDEEKMNEYKDREASLKEIMSNEKLPQVQKELASNCLLQLQVHVSKMSTPGGEEASASSGMPTEPQEESSGL